MRATRPRVRRFLKKKEGKRFSVVASSRRELRGADGPLGAVAYVAFNLLLAACTRTAPLGRDSHDDGLGADRSPFDGAIFAILNVAFARASFFFFVATTLASWS